MKTLINFPLFSNPPELIGTPLFIHFCKLVQQCKTIVNCNAIFIQNTCNCTFFSAEEAHQKKVDGENNKDEEQKKADGEKNEDEEQKKADGEKKAIKKNKGK